MPICRRACIALLFLLWIPVTLPAGAQAVTETSEATPEATQTIPCTVRTDSANTISVRVGPGGNRTVFAFLPADQDFAVLGQAEADDGGLWW